MEVKTTGLVPMTALPEGVLSQPAVLSALRRSEVLRESMNSDRIDLEADWSVVVRVDEYEEAQIVPFEGVADQIRMSLARQVAWDALLAHAADLTGQLRENPDLEALAEHDGAKLTTHTGLRRDAADVPGPVLEKAFSLPRPAGSPSFSMAVLLDGVALLAVDAVHETPSEEDQSEDRDNLRERMRFSETEAFQAALATQAQITRYPDRLE